MKNSIIKEGYKYNYLTIIKEIEGCRRVFKCKCDCGKEVNVILYSLVSGHTKSCGCYKGNIGKTITHGMYYKRIYKIFRGIKGRCLSNKNIYYGGRGIKCEWNTFEDFYKDMGKKYKDGLSLDRIDNNGNYCKENCRWTTMKFQGTNKRNNIKYKGKLLLDWCKELGLNYMTVQSRIHRGKTIEQSLFFKKQKNDPSL